METHNAKGHRVVVTGMGALSCLGTSPAEMWENLINRQSGIRAITNFDSTDFEIKIAGEVRGYDALAELGPDWAYLGQRYSQLALGAALKAAEDAGLDPDAGDLEEAAIIGANAHGDQNDYALGGWDLVQRKEFTAFAEHQYYDNVQKAMEQKAAPYRTGKDLFMRMFYEHPTALVGARFGSIGPRFTISSACVSGAKVIERAVRYLRRGQVPIAVTGGCEAVVTPVGIWFLNAMRALSTHAGVPGEASRPFDVNRTGFVLAEAGAMLILETLENALGRDANILAEVVGVGGSGNAFSLYAPEPVGEGPASSMNAALRDAGMNYDEVDAVFAHATATGVGDPAEAEGIKLTFREHAPNVSIIATKANMGHAIAAAGALGAIKCVMAIQTGRVPPILNLEEPIEQCANLRLVKDEPEERPFNCVLNNAFGFGGANGSNIFRRFEG